MLFALVLFTLGCRTEITNENETNITQSDFRKTIKLKDASAFKNYLTEIKNNPSHTYSKNEDIFSSLSNEATVTVISQHNVTSYSTVIKHLDRSSDVLVYSVDNENKSIGFIAQYKPADLTKNYHIDNFTGTVEYTAIDGRPMGTRELVNGVPLTPKANGQKITANKGGCSYGIKLIEVACGDANYNHTPSEYAQCKADQKPYYIVEITEACPSGGLPPKGLPNMGFYDGGGDGGGGGTFNEMSIQDSFNYMLNESGFAELTPNEYTYIQNNQYVGGKLLSYFYNSLNQNNTQLLHGAIQYFMQNTNSNETFVTAWKKFEPLITFADQFIQQNPDTLNIEQIFIRINDLNNAVNQNPNLLLDISCAQLSQLDDWSNIATHSVPLSVKNKVQNIKNQTNFYDNWKITDLDDGIGARLNMDLFPVKITNLPNKPGTNQKYTPEEFFDFFRKNINQFAEKFIPIQDTYYGIDDTTLWFSNNPLGALIHIEIPGDDGTVICTGYWTNSWMFTTVKAPLDWYHDGIHPVAGNRLFSYTMVGSEMYIYTRGVDRVSHNYSDKASLVNHIIESIAFTGADNLWNGMQDKLSNFVTTHGGQASKVPAIKYRPKYTQIKDYIKGKIPINTLNCN